ncbi:MAG: four helix bundle protein [Candidatus Latescibacteria bacterium]|nr:four helix bundle protein [Candidatus Latescibacterota bacterium]
MNSYRDLIVWQKSMELVIRVYAITKPFPAEKLYGITSQIRKSAVSIPSNIIELYNNIRHRRFLPLCLLSCFKNRNWYGMKEE